MFQVLNKVTGGKPRATRRSYGGRRVILKTLVIVSRIINVLNLCIVFLRSRPYSPRPFAKLCKCTEVTDARRS